MNEDLNLSPACCLHYSNPRQILHSIPTPKTVSNRWCVSRSGIVLPRMWIRSFIRIYRCDVHGRSAWVWRCWSFSYSAHQLARDNLLLPQKHGHHSSLHLGRHCLCQDELFVLLQEAHWSSTPNAHVLEVCVCSQHPGGNLWDIGVLCLVPTLWWF